MTGTWRGYPCDHPRSFGELINGDDQLSDPYFEDSLITLNVYSMVLVYIFLRWVLYLGHWDGFSHHRLDGTSVPTDDRELDQGHPNPIKPCRTNRYGMRPNV